MIGTVIIFIISLSASLFGAFYHARLPYYDYSNASSQEISEIVDACWYPKVGTALEGDVYHVNPLDKDLGRAEPSDDRNPYSKSELKKLKPVDEVCFEISDQRGGPTYENMTFVQVLSFAQHDDAYPLLATLNLIFAVLWILSGLVIVLFVLQWLGNKRQKKK